VGGKKYYKFSGHLRGPGDTTRNPVGLKKLQTWARTDKEKGATVAWKKVGDRKGGAPTWGGGDVSMGKVGGRGVFGP